MKSSRTTLTAFIAFALLATAGTSKAQLLNRLKNKANQTVDKVVDKGADKLVDKAINGDSKAPAKQPASASSTNTASDASAKAGPEVNTITSFSKFDFVPGERVLYAEDFSQDNVGELPVNWNSNANGVVVSVNEPKGKWLQLASGVYLSGNKVRSFGKDFTIEFDVILNVTPKTGYYLPPITFGVFGSGTEDPADNKFLSHQNLYNSFQVKIDPKANENTAAHLLSYDKRQETFRSPTKLISTYAKTLRRVAHYSISVQGSRLRIWIDETKVFDIPRAVNASVPINQLYFKTETTGGFNDENFSYLLSNIKVAAGAPDTRSKLVTTGKFVTTGILFDVNSDKIKPESYGTIKEIADVLKENADLKVKIIGHTDSDGSAALNTTLSKKRAEAVKNFLASTFSIEAARLQTDGKGASQPVADNKTATGKASNRRVEFIKIS